MVRLEKANEDQLMWTKYWLQKKRESSISPTSSRIYLKKQNCFGKMNSYNCYTLFTDYLQEIIIPNLKKMQF